MNNNQRVPPITRADIKDSVFDFCYDMALRDSTNQGAYLGTIDDLKNSSLIGSSLNASVRAYVDSLYSDEPKMPKDVIKEINNNLTEFNKGKTDSYKFDFGNVQKLVNMTAKYIFVSKYNDESNRDHFEYCDCPIDNKISKIAYVEGMNVGLDFELVEGYFDDFLNGHRSLKQFFKNMRFSRLNDKEYDYLQSVIKEISSRKGIIPIEFDYYYWNKYSNEEIDNEMRNRN